VTNKRLRALTISLGLIGVASLASAMGVAGGRLFESPSALFWAALAALVAVIPIRRLIGTQHINLGSLLTFTILLLYGTTTAVITAWLVAVASVASTRCGNLKADIERAMLRTGRHVVGVWAAGLLLWGRAANHGALDTGLPKGTIPALLAGFGLYLIVKWVIETIETAFRDNKPLNNMWRPRIDRASISVWIIPPAAYLLGLAYLNSSALTITMMLSLLLVQGLTVGEDRRSRHSWVRLTDGLRQACDGHVMRHKGETQQVVEIATEVGRKMKLPPANLRLLGHAAALHNVGYIALDSRLVLRPGNLSPEEIAAVRQHPNCSRRILNDVPGMVDVAEIVRCHHESPDGRGYPRGLSGGTIPIEAAIVKVAEAFVAMTHPRVYRGKALTRDRALEEIAGSTGQAFDPIVAYYLFVAMGRDDLASTVSRQFGMPEKSNIRRRLAKPSLRTGTEVKPARPVRRSMLTGFALILAALGLTILFESIGISDPVGTPPAWFNLHVPGALFLLSLFGLAVLKPGRLGWGAYCSWASAPMLAMVLAGGPIYIPISGIGFIGWALLIKPGSERAVATQSADSGRDGSGRSQPGPSPSERGGQDSNIPTEAYRIHAAKLHHRVIARIDRSNRVLGDLGLKTYGLVLMLAGGCAWAACFLGYQVMRGSIIGLILSPLLIGVVATGTFYVAETFLQAALLSRQDLSPVRIWYRNYANAFPEPLTYAMLGYGIYIVSSLLGLWTAMLVFMLPLLWRQGVLADRTKTQQISRALVRSIAKAVDLKNAEGREHAWGVAATAVAIARRMGKSEPFVEQLEDASILHDVGKASWPNKALVQGTPWDSKQERYRYIHPDISAEIAVWAGYSETTTNMIRSHHEHYDGSGYMHGLKGAEIPAGARILSTADSFANMIEGGDPRFSRTLAETVREIRFRSGRQFDPVVVQALLDVLEGAVFGESPEPERAGLKPEPEEIALGAR